MSDTQILKRMLESRIDEARADTPVIMIIGPRQSGKTTLVKELVKKKYTYVTLDDRLTLLSVRNDPMSLLQQHEYLVIDEIQRVPELLIAIKKTIDENRKPGRFILTGSANVMVLPKVADSLAGRMETLTLLPFAQCEIEKKKSNWLDSIFDGRPPMATRSKNLVERVLRGGYAEMLRRPTPQRRTSWARQYIKAVVERDVKDIAAIEKLGHLPKFLQVLAQTAGQMCNYTALGGQLQFDGKTAANYIGVLENMFLLKRIEPWANNKLSRLVKTPKLQFLDSGLLASLLGVTAEEIKRDRTRFGVLLETFVYSELLKFANVSYNDYRFMYYRDADKYEVDFIIENIAGELIGIEVKSTISLRESDLRNLKKWSSLAGKKYKMGILFYSGDETLPLGNNIWCVPFSSLWG
ncbi:MAG: hypothetical protein LDLANPLL_01650 [Turneriella sp.]|nr:hypothetical protein [Turneriella sp.]